MAQEYAKKFYNSKAWKNCQASYLKSVCYLCERCGSIAAVVHHRVHISPDKIDDTNITLDWNNLEALCLVCHNEEHMKKYSAKIKEISFDEKGNVVYTPLSAVTGGIAKTAAPPFEAPPRKFQEFFYFEERRSEFDST